MDFTQIITAVDLMAVGVFAATGALVASRRQLDIFGFILLGTATGIGGGSVRDVLLGQLPVFWVQEPAYLAMCIIVSALTYFTAHLLGSRFQTLLWLDALGLSLFCVLGVERALAADAHPLVAVMMGGVTATFGGIIRDVLSAERPLILSREIYMTAALMGAVIYMGGLALGVTSGAAAATGIAGCFLTRAGGLQLGWQLPVYKAKPPRPRQ